MGQKKHGPQLLSAIEHNDRAKVHEILASEIRQRDKVREICTTAVRYMASNCFDVPLLLAASLPDPSILQYIVATHMVDVNTVHKQASGKKIKVQTALLTAVRRGNYDTVEMILGLHGDPNIQDHKGRSALHHAVRKADFRMAKMLLARGAQPSLVDMGDNTPLHVAAIFGHKELCRMMIHYGADPYKRGQLGALPLHVAAKEGHVQLLRLFIQLEVNPNIKIPCYDMREKAALHVAAEEGHFECVKLLIEELGADVNLQDSEGETALHCTVLHEYDPLGMKSKEDYNETVKVLLRNGAQVNQQNGRGETPLHLAASNEFQKIVEILLQSGADPLIEDNAHDKPIERVSEDDVVSSQIIRQVMANREKFMNDMLEMKARGFSTSASQSALMNKSLPALDVSGDMLSSSRGKAASTLALLDTSMRPSDDGVYLSPIPVNKPMVNGQYEDLMEVEPANTKNKGKPKIGTKELPYSNEVKNAAKPIVNSAGKVAKEPAEYTNANQIPATKKELTFKPAGYRTSIVSTTTNQTQGDDYDDDDDDFFDDESFETLSEGYTLDQHPQLKEPDLAPVAGPNPIMKKWLDEQADITKQRKHRTPSVECEPRQASSKNKHSLENNKPKKTAATAPIKTVPDSRGRRFDVQLAHPEVGQTVVRIVPAGDPSRTMSRDHHESVSSLSDSETNLVFGRTGGNQLEDDASSIGSYSTISLMAPPSEGKVIAIADELRRQNPNLFLRVIKETDDVDDDYEEDEPETGHYVARILSNKAKTVQPSIKVSLTDNTDTAGTPIVPVNGNAVAASKPAPKPVPRKSVPQSTSESQEQPNPPKKLVVKPTVMPPEVIKPTVKPPEKPDVPHKPTPPAKPDVPVKPASKPEPPVKPEKARRPSKSATDATPEPQPVKPPIVENSSQPLPVKDEDIKTGRRQPKARNRAVKTSDSGERTLAIQPVANVTNEGNNSTGTPTFQEYDDYGYAKVTKAKLNKVPVQQQVSQTSTKIVPDSKPVAQTPATQVAPASKSAETPRTDNVQKLTGNVNSVVENESSSGEDEESWNSDDDTWDEETADESTPSNARKIVFNCQQFAGFDVVGGNADGIFVSQVLPSSPAQKAGLKEGDKILKINSYNTKGQTREEVCGKLNQLSGLIELSVTESPSIYQNIKKNGGCGDSFHVRAHFNRKASPKSKELNIKPGDIFYVQDTLPQEAPGSWKVFKVTSTPGEDPNGLIPNQSHADDIAFDDSLSNNTEKKSGFLKRAKRTKSVDRVLDRSLEDLTVNRINVKSYEWIEQKTSEFRRPVVILGLFSDSVLEMLSSDCPGLFHVPQEPIENFRAGPGEPKVYCDVLVSIQRGLNKHALLILSPDAIKFMQTKTDLDPIVIYLSPGSKNTIKYIRNTLAPGYDKKPSYLYEEATHFEKDFASLFTATVSYTADDSWFTLLKDTIDRLQSVTHWVPFRRDEKNEEDHSQHREPRNFQRNTSRSRSYSSGAMLKSDMAETVASNRAPRTSDQALTQAQVPVPQGYPQNMSQQSYQPQASYQSYPQNSGYGPPNQGYPYQPQPNYGYGPPQQNWYPPQNYWAPPPRPPMQRPPQPPQQQRPRAQQQQSVDISSAALQMLEATQPGPGNKKSKQGKETSF